jgi:hypothetical protein
MAGRWVRAALTLVLTASSLNSGRGEDAVKPVVVVIRTELGDIEVELDGAKAPATVANFLRYVAAGGFRRLAGAAVRSELGGLPQAALRRPPAGAQVLGPLYAPRGHQ